MQPPASDTTTDHASSEAALLERLRAGDERAFEELVRSAGGRMYAVARRMLPSDDDAADAVQEAFASAFTHLDRFDGRSRLTTWLHRITVNACLMKLRSRRRRPETSLDALLPTYLPDGHQTTSTPKWKPSESVGIESAEVRALVRAAIDRLPDEARDIIVMRDLAGLSLAETAQELGLSEAAAKSRLHRARQALRALLERHFGEEAR